MPHTGLVDKVSTRYRRDTVQPSDINLAYEKLRDTFRTDEVHSKTVVNALIAAIAETMDSKRPVPPIASGARVNTVTHGFPARGDVSTVSPTANQLRGSLLYLPEATSFVTIGINVAAPAAGGIIRLGVGDYNFLTKTASNILDAGTVTSDASGDKTLAAVTSRGPGWIVLMAYFSATISVQAFNPGSGYSYNTTGTIVCTPVQTGVAFSAFSATETFNTDSTTLLSTWLVAA